MSETTPSSTGRVYYWSHLTAPEINALAHEAVVIMPIAATEQHGPHMVTGTDTLLNQLLQRGLIEHPPEDGNYLVLPTLPIGASEHHIAFGGTYTLPPTLYIQVLVQTIRTLIKEGHRRIFLLNSHGGNVAPMQSALAELANEALEQEVLIGGAGYWDICLARWQAEIPALRLPRVGHACEIEASLLMLGNPELPLRSHPAGHPFPDFLLEGLGLAAAYPSISANGFVGYPEEASMEKGEALFRIAMECLRKTISNFAKRPLSPLLPFA